MAKAISDEQLVRVLGEYSEKAMRAFNRHEIRSAVSTIYYGFATLILAAGALLVTIGLLIEDVPLASVAGTVLVFIVLAFGTMVKVHVTQLRTEVELAAWQLRRIYELVSRREDLGVDLDSGTRLEIELRLSEAGFLLTTLERFDKPEKFQHFRRVGPESPFRVLEPSDSPWIKPRVTQTGEPAPQSTPPGPPDSIVSPS